MFKVTLDHSALRNLSKKARQAIEEIVSNSDFKRSVAQDVIDDIRGVARSGKSVVTGKRFEKLSEQWIETRKKIIAYQGAPPYVLPSKSNISLSGQLLDSLTYKQSVVRGSGFDITFFFSGKRKPYIYAGKKGLVYLRSSVTNEELSKILDDRFQFIGIRQKLQDQIRKRLIDYYLLIIKKLNLEV